MTSLASAIMRQVDELAAISEEPGLLTRTFLTAQHKRAGEAVIGWMRDAGMAAAFDAIGNVVGRYEGRSPGLPALWLGSHLDTVRDAGRYDGMLGVLSAIACVGALKHEGVRLPFAIEVFGFADEEGARFQSALSGSRAIAGTFDPASLEKRDGDGVSMGDALRRFGGDPAAIATVGRRAEQALAYVELHIEQGPVLEAKGMPLGVVTAIAGASRYAIEIAGKAGHAGTVLLVEKRCAEAPGLVGTVGRLSAMPGAVNVIPGLVRFSLDIRAAEDGVRRAAVDDILRGLEAICRRRGVQLDVGPIHEHGSTACAPWITAQIERAIAAQGVTPLALPSGAGHDAMALAGLVDVGMLFVRCKGGISHNPAEAISMEDAEIGAAALLRFIRDFAPKSARA